MIEIQEDTPQKQIIPKWLTINNVNLYESDRDALMGNEWLNDQHIYVAL